jgi:hypothetical protein
MVGVGCLLPLILLIAGALLGSHIGGAEWVPWGAALGFVAGATALGFLGFVVARMKRR